jgi:hypothetical protein
MDKRTYRYVELIGINGRSIEQDLDEFGAQGYRLVAYDIGKHVAVFERREEHVDE